MCPRMNGLKRKSRVASPLCHIRALVTIEGVIREEIRAS